MKPTCRHCGRETASRPRGLGWNCFYTPGVRELYAVSDSVCAGHGVGGDNGLRRPPPAAPTAARPGSPEKLAVLIERAGREELLHHPLDARITDGA